VTTRKNQEIELAVEGLVHKSEQRQQKRTDEVTLWSLVGKLLYWELTSSARGYCLRKGTGMGGKDGDGPFRFGKGPCAVTERGCSEGIREAHAAVHRGVDRIVWEDLAVQRIGIIDGGTCGQGLGQGVGE
jgi:hypothetical protein